jgi:hypothetical protein
MHEVDSRSQLESMIIPLSSNQTSLCCVQPQGLISQGYIFSDKATLTIEA